MRTRSSSSMHSGIPVVDLFAGAGGLGEGFSAFAAEGTTPFDVRLSVEKDPVACATLTLRKYVRQFARPPDELAGYFAGELTRQRLFDSFPDQAQRAQQATWQAELGKVAPQLVARRVRMAIGDRRDWVLLGGPPCQAYSMVGRARMRGIRADFERDERHLLYREYLRIVADHEPAVFVMENVKGLLTSHHGGSRIVTRILDDLASPAEAVGSSRNRGLRYRLYALGPKRSVLPWVEDSRPDGEEFLVRAEEHGIPQTRHRLFIVGVRSDVPGRPSELETRPEVTADAVLADLPPIRSMLSREDDSLARWREAVGAIVSYDWMSAAPETALGRVAREVRKVVRGLPKTQLDSGAQYTSRSTSPGAWREWYRPNAIGLTHHVARAHMRDDLHRYLFVTCFAAVHRRSPKLRDFPSELHPSHQNVSRAVRGNLFDDRFRVQLADRPATTITSHVSKDGHYYIHYDPRQCRSLTVREAARLQTFPDSYFFEGNRTQQYGQVGNAVPPLLAREIARVVHGLLVAARRSSGRAAMSSR